MKPDMVPPSPPRHPTRMAFVVLLLTMMGIILSGASPATAVTVSGAGSKCAKPCDLETHFVGENCKCILLTECTGGEVETVPPTATSDRQCGLAPNVDCAMDGDWLAPEARVLLTTRYVDSPGFINGTQQYISLDGRFALVTLHSTEGTTWLGQLLPPHAEMLPAWYLVDSLSFRVLAAWDAATSPGGEIAALTPDLMPNGPATVFFYSDDVPPAAEGAANSVHLNQKAADAATPRSDAPATSTKEIDSPPSFVSTMDIPQTATTPPLSPSITVPTIVAAAQDPSTRPRCVAACHPDDPCCFLSRNTQNLLWLRVPLSAVRTCFHSLTIDGVRMRSTLQTLREGAAEYYSFVNIAADSLAGDHSLRPGLEGCSFDVHEMKVDIVQWLDTQLRDLDKAADVNSDGHVSKAELRGVRANAADFHFETAAAFSRLNDAHTLYILPAPLGGFYVDMGFFIAIDDKTTENSKTSNKNNDDDNNNGNNVCVRVCLKENANTTFSTCPWHEGCVSAINNQDPVTWLADLATNIGLFKSRGVRLNRLLQELDGPLLWAYAFGQNWSDQWLDDGVTFKFEDKRLSPITAQPQAVVQGRLTRVQLQTELDRGYEGRGVIATTPAVGSWNGVHYHQEEKNVAREGGAGLHNENDVRAPNGAEQQAPPQPLSSSSSSSSSASSPPSSVSSSSQPWEVVENTTVPGFLEARIVHVNSSEGGDGSEVMVLKICSFAADTLTFLEHFEAVDNVTAQVVDVAKERGIHRLLVDVATNGGGYVALLWYMLQVVAGVDHWSSSEELCEGVNVRLSDTARAWLQTASQNPNDLLPDVDRLPSSDELVQHATETADAFAAIDPSLRPTPDADVLCVVFDCEALYMAKAVESAVSPRQYGEWLRASLIGTAFLQPQYRDLLDAPSTPFNDLRARVILATEVQHNWGGRSANYSAVHTLECHHICELYGGTCPSQFAAFSRQFTDVALLTDGTCGSACSAFSTALMFTGKVTVYGYGGEPGVPMDTSSFAGGNVEEWDNFWPQLSRQLRLTSFLGKFNPVPQHKPDALAPTMRLPTSAAARFNFHQLFFRHLGPQSLPREWYNLPPHKQLRVWMGLPDAHPDRLGSVYVKVAADDWEDVRTNPEFYDARCTQRYARDTERVDPWIRSTTTSTPWWWSSTTTSTPSHDSGRADGSKSARFVYVPILAAVATGVVVTAVFLVVIPRVRSRQTRYHLHSANSEGGDGDDAAVEEFEVDSQPADDGVVNNNPLEEKLLSHEHAVL